MPDSPSAQSETALRQAEGWRRVAVADAKAWKARAVAAEAERDDYREALEMAWGEAYLGCLEGESAERACDEVLKVCMRALGVTSHFHSAPDQNQRNTEGADA